MQTEAAERRRQTGRSRRGEAGQSRAEPPGSKHRAGGSSEEETAKFLVSTRQQTGRGGGGGEEEKRGRDRSRGDGGRRREARSRRTASEGGEGDEESGRLRWRVHQLEKEKLELTSGHNQELCRLQAELTRLRSAVERGEARGAELQYELTVSRRDGERDKHTLTERAAELQQEVEELQEALNSTQHALQQEVEERERLIRSFSSETQRLQRLLQEQEEALQESERRRSELQEEREKEEELNRRQAREMEYLTEREERSRREKEVSDQRVKTLESRVEAERAAHLESKFNSEIIQLRVRDLEAVLAAERCGQQEATCGLELLRAQFRDVERVYGLEREKSCSTERELQSLQEEFKRCKSDLSVALETEMKTTSDLTEKLEEEKRQHANTHTLLEQATQTQSDVMRLVRQTLQQHTSSAECSETSPAAEDDGNMSSSAEVLQLLKTTLDSCRDNLETSDKQVHNLLFASEKLQEENQSLRHQTAVQSRQMEELQQAAIKLDQEVTRLRQESCDWSTQSRQLQAELEREREERTREREREGEERKREREREREERKREREEMEREEEERKREREREREERTAEVKKMTDDHQKESQVRLSFLYLVYQRLLAGCVLIHQPQCIVGNFTWKELCDVINEQVDRLTSDLQEANSKIAHLQSVCEKKSVCVRELQRSQECVLSRLEESVRRREEAWSSQHTHTVRQLHNELQVCRSQCDSLRDHASSLQLQASSLTSDLSRLQGLLSRSRGESTSFLSACALLAGALKHTHRRLQTLCRQKTLLSRRLAEKEELEEEVRRLAGALGGEEEEEEEEEEGGRRRRSRAVRRWRRSVCVVLAVRRWRVLAKQTTVLFQVEVGGGGPAVCVCGGTATRRSQENTDEDDDGDEGRAGVCVRWLRSKTLSSAVLSSMSDLQAALSHTGPAPPDVTSASRSALSRLLDHLLGQSDAPSSLSLCRLDEETLSGRLNLGLRRLTPRQPSSKALVSTLQQHFLLFSQRLHSAEVERRSLRLEVTNLKKGLREEVKRTVPAERFHTVCVELRQALSREQEAQSLVQKQTEQLHTLRLRVDTHSSAQSDTRDTLTRITQSLSEARQEVSRKERSLRILGKHLSGVQRERKQLEERLRQVEDELKASARRKDLLISNMKAAETSYKEVRESLVQSLRCPSAQPRPLLLPREHLELSAESIMGAAETAACQSLLSAVSQLYQTCSSRIDWLEQEVSAHRSHVTALRSELQDVCLRDNLTSVPVTEFPETSPLVVVETSQPVQLPDLSKEPSVTLNPAPSQTNPASSPPRPKPSRTKTKEKKAAKENRVRRLRERKRFPASCFHDDSPEIR